MGAPDDPRDDEPATLAEVLKQHMGKEDFNDAVKQAIERVNDENQKLREMKAEAQ